MRTRLTAAAVGVALTIAGGGIAHATTTPVTIAMSNATTACDGTHAEITAILHNDGGPDEDVQVYLEPNPGVGGIGVPVQYNQAVPNPIHIPSGAQAFVHLPYENGSAVFDAIAVAHGATFPTSTTALTNGENAKTAASSELSPGQYPTAPSGCTPPPWHPCPPNWPIDLYPVVQTCPVWTPPPAPADTTQPKNTSAAPPKPSAKPTSHPSSHSAAPVTTSTTPKPSVSSSSVAKTAPVVPQVEVAEVTVSASSSTPPVASVTEATSIPAQAAASMAHQKRTAPILVGLALLVALVGVGCAIAGSRRNHWHR